VTRTTVAGALVAGALCFGAAASATSIDVSIALSQYRNANGVNVLVFVGTVSSSAAGETVDVLGQDCGTRGYRLIQGTSTRPGGAWRATNPQEESPWRYTPVTSGATFKARWNNQESGTVIWRAKAPFGATKLKSRRAWRVWTIPASAFVSMKGKPVLLQRLRGGSWATIQRKKLAHKPSFTKGAFNHEAVFEIPRRGWTVRAVLPAKSAAPCYLASVTEQWRT
jgi:hypothetical protein